MRDGEQEQEQDEDSVDSADREVIDLTAMDVVLTQEREEEATVSLIYDDVDND